LRARLSPLHEARTTIEALLESQRAEIPFTEPSAGFEVTCAICRSDGCRTCSLTGWIELSGCGMVDPAVFTSLGIDADVWTGFAFGFAIDR
jgi:phenylalanyl-tRNA synthetase alpha chain